MERWEPIADYEGLYEVSDLGRVRSLHRLDSAGRNVKGCVLKASTCNDYSHQVVKLSRDGLVRCVLVHRLVALAFIGPPPSRLHRCAHKDGITVNNRLDNLEWKSLEKITEDDLRDIRSARAAGKNVKDIAAHYNVGFATIYRHLRLSAEQEQPSAT